MGVGTVISLFEEQVTRMPEAPAVVFEGQTLTYGELERRSNQFAHHLRRLGVEREVRVALCVERSLSLVVGVLGILKAGGVYVPLDPESPEERLSWLLEDAQPRVVVTQESLVARLSGEGFRRVVLEREHAAIAACPEAPPESGVREDDVAYLVYTSGSTGRPKGAMNTHRGLCNRTCWVRGLADPSEPVRVLMKAPLGFDVSVAELFWPLLSGGELVMVRPGGHRDTRYLVELIQQRRVTAMDMVPAVLRMLLEEEGVERCTSLRRVLCGGEVLPPALQEHFHRVLRAELYNVYGPSETAVDALVWRCEPGWTGTTVPLGRPLPGVRAHVLDAVLRPVPEGVAGELFLGGEGVGRGYWRRPERTAESFLADPFSDEPGARMYRTGDRVLTRPDGTLEFLGRVDFQVKLRGVRIEPGEIEAALMEEPGVSGAVVVLREDARHGPRLVGYVTANPGVTLDVARLKTSLTARLPRALVPSVLRVLDAFPLNAHGKVDRPALPAPEPELERPPYVAPSTPTERMLATLWAGLLRLERVGAEDHFFELGGHSLLALKVLTRVRESFGVELPLSALFENPTVCLLAARIEHVLQAQGADTRPVLARVSRDAPIPLAPPQALVWWLLETLGLSPEVFNLFLGFRLRGPLELPALRRAVDDLCRRHESLRTSFREEGGSVWQVISPEPTHDFTLVDLSSSPEPEQEAARIAQREALRPFLHRGGVLMRISVLRLAEDTHDLLLTYHHMVMDGTSEEVLLEDLTALYAHHATGAPLALPPLPFQFADFTGAWLEAVRDEALAPHLEFWLRTLAGRPVAPPLPDVRPPSEARSGTGGVLVFELSPALTESLRRLALEQGATLFMTLLAAFRTLLLRRSGRADECIGTPVAMRTHTGVERITGVFADMLILRLDAGGAPSFLELLSRVRRVVLDSYAHMGVPLGRLMNALPPGEGPPFQVVFSFDPAPLAFNLPGLTSTRLEVEAPYDDLGLNFVERPEGLQARFFYNKDLYTPEVVSSLAEDLCALLEGLVAAPHARITELPLAAPRPVAQTA